MPRLPKRMAVVRDRNVRLLLAGQGASVLGDRVVAVALAFAVLEVGGSVSEVGLVLAGGTLPLVAAVLFGGVVADRAPRRTVMIVCDLMRLASQGAMAALLIAGAADVWMLALLAGLTGACTGFFSPASTALLPEIVKPTELQPANALRTSAVSAGEIAGPLLAGVVVAAAGAGWAIAADAVTFAISAACLAAMRVPARKPRERAPFLADLRDGWTAFRSRRWVWTFVLYFAIGNMLWGAWSALGPVVADRELGGAAAWGAVLAALGVGALAGSVLAAWARPSRPLLFVVCAEAVFGVALAFLAAGVPALVLAGAALVSGVGMMVTNSVWETTIQRHIPAESLSRVSSYDWFGSFAFYPVGLAVWGPLAGLVGVGTALWIAFALFMASVAALLALPDVRRLPAVPV